MEKETHRKEIDGLRGLAALLVVLFHLEFQFQGYLLFEGGWLGVDLFFIISGYLITRQLLQNLKANKFSLSSFFERRIRRIFPPLTLTLLLSSILSWLFLMPNDLLKFSYEFIASSFMVSNIYFWIKDGYASLIHSHSLLIHTWSLSVEEQFYIFFPTLLLLFQKKIYFFYTLLVFLFLISLSINFVPSYQNASTAFFLTHFRIWEILAGTLVALLENQFSTHRKKRIYSFTSNLGLCLIFTAVILSNYLGAIFSQLFLALGSVFIILFYQNKNVILNRVLTVKPLLWIGLISYSLYLFHMPLIQLSKIHGLFPLVLFKIAVLLISLYCASLSWIFFETKMRDRTFPFRKVSLICASLFSVTFFINTHFIETEGAKYRVEQDLLDMIKEMEKIAYDGIVEGENSGLDINGKLVHHCVQRDPLTPCVFGNGDWILIGDSYAGQIEGSLQKALKLKGKGLISLVHSACPFFSPTLDVKTANNCPRVNKRRLQYLKSIDKKRTIVVFSNNDMFHQSQFTDFSKKSIPDIKKFAISSYKKNIMELLRMGHRVIYLLNYPKPRIDSVQKAFNEARFNHFSKKYIYNSVYMRSSALQEAIQMNIPFHMSSHKNFKQLNLVSTFCDDKKRCKAVERNGPLFSRDHHLSPIGTDLIVKEIIAAAM